jgi:hypothetical protein
MEPMTLDAPEVDEGTTVVTPTSNDLALILIDQALADTGARSLVASTEVADILLDLRRLLGPAASN